MHCRLVTIIIMVSTCKVQQHCINKWMLSRLVFYLEMWIVISTSRMQTHHQTIRSVSPGDVHVLSKSCRMDINGSFQVLTMSDILGSKTTYQHRRILSAWRVNCEENVPFLYLREKNTQEKFSDNRQPFAILQNIFVTIVLLYYTIYWPCFVCQCDHHLISDY